MLSIRNTFYNYSCTHMSVFTFPDNSGVECQTLMQFLTDNTKITFKNVDETFCSSSKNFHWFNSIAQVPLSQVCENIHSEHGFT